MGDSNKIGARLAALRNERKLSPADLASRSGISESELGAIESGRHSPSIAPLVKLSRALGVRLGTLLDDAEVTGPIVVKGGHAAEVIRVTESDSQKLGTLTFFSLARGKTGRSMEPFIVDIRPGAKDATLSTHEGEEFIYVLEGEVDLRYGSDTIKIAAGDSVYYDSIVPHRVSSSAPAKALAVVYAPF
jgi:transcriptional regulator with XRE-family HTH domain